MTGSSTVTNLKVTNSAIVFAPPGSGAGFKTLTVTNYVGSGANITLYAALGGSNSASDRIIINGGSATGSTLLTIKNVGGVGGATTGAGIPIVVATNGGTIASNAFALASTPVVGGFKYTLDQTNQVGISCPRRPTTVGTRSQNSINTVAKAQQTQIITNRVLDLDPARRDRADQLLELRFRLRLDRFVRGRRARAMGTHRRADADGRRFLQPVERLDGITVTNAPTVAGIARLRLLQPGHAAGHSSKSAGGSRPMSRSPTPATTRTATRPGSEPRRPSIAISRCSGARAGSACPRSTRRRSTAISSRNWMQTGGYSE